MEKYLSDQIVCPSPLFSNISSINKYRLTRSQQLNTPYRPNFKKLSSRRKLYSQQSLLTLRQLFDLNKLQKLIINPIQKAFICPLCQYQYPEQQMFEVCQCHHKYCQHCLIQFVSYKINSMQEIMCPDEYCNAKIKLDGQIFVKLPEDLKTKYRKAEMWRQTMGNPDLKLCPMEYCEGQIDMKISPPTCSLCRKQYCEECMMQKHLGNCDAIYEMTHKEWRRCPKCRMFIAKTQGCNHIRCRCDFEFCFVCLQKWNNSHYNCMQKSQMLYFNMENMKWPFGMFLLMIILTPILAILSIVGILVCFSVMIPVGFVMGMGLTILKYYYLLCFVIVIMPIGGLIGVFLFPFYFTLGQVFPYFVHHFRRYKLTLQQLYEMSQGVSN